MTRIFILCLLSLFLLTEPALRAQDYSPTAAVQFQCKGTKSASEQEMASARVRLKVALLEKHIASCEPGRQQLLSSQRVAMEKDIDTLLLSYTERPPRFDGSTRILTLSAQCTINQGRIQQLIGGVRTMVSPAEESSPQKSMVCIFVARRQAKVQTKAAKVETGTQVRNSREAEKQSESSGGESRAAEHQASTEVVASISSTTRTADEIQYVIEDNAKAGIEGAIARVFVERGYDIRPSSTLVAASKGKFNIDGLLSDFERGSQFSEANLDAIAKACYNAGVDMLSFGTLTIDAQMRDTVVANQVVVNVRVDGQVLDCSRLGKTRARLDDDGNIVEQPRNYVITTVKARTPSRQISKAAPDQSQAETLALDEAADSVANLLADQLTAAGIR